MDTTALASSLLDPLPAHVTSGIRVVSAADGRGEVATTVPERMTNVIGSLHSSGLIALADAAGLAAIIGACRDEAGFRGVIPLGRAASLEFLAPGRGLLTAVCVLGEDAANALRLLYEGRTVKARLSTTATITDATGTAVCRGTFDWSLRRTPSDGASGGRADG
ncbi:DUF4442 domain-containing protein [Actinocorallia longicatena]|uniref:Acyl-coenzyme A thioesterase PaaI-like protein n=1 Tax=Actinocorallia longicatena TaxID=111803 RepID=A0ABP6QFH8_9ACTN